MCAHGRLCSSPIVPPCTGPAVPWRAVPCCVAQVLWSAFLSHMATTSAPSAASSAYSATPPSSTAWVASPASASAGHAAGAGVASARKAM